MTEAKDIYEKIVSKLKPTPIIDYEFCKGENPHGENKCGYREQCKRYLTGGYRVHYVNFWQHANDDCSKYESRSL